MHLSSNDALFVDTIHTDAGAYGTARICATVQFYVNKGFRIQPGCPTHYEFFSEEGKYHLFYFLFLLFNIF
jgi:hypothetical protein